MCAILWVGQDKARSLELNLGLPYGWQGPKYLSRHLLPLRVHTGRKRELELESELEPVYSDVRCTYPKQHLNLTSYIYHQPLLWGFLESSWPVAHCGLHEWLRQHGHQVGSTLVLCTILPLKFSVSTFGGSYFTLSSRLKMFTLSFQWQFFKHRNRYRSLSSLWYKSETPLNPLAIHPFLYCA